MKEAYVSFEVAELLKEKGFKQYNCAHSYDSNGVFKWGDNLDPYEYSAPTHQMACAWLREVHHTFIEIGTSIDLNGNYHFSYTILDKECKYRGYNTNFGNYEDAVESALKYSLENLI